jgi:hypothetical protein
VASLAANVAVAEPTATGRVIAAWPSFALIAAYELLMRQVRRSTAASGKAQHSKPGPQISSPEDRGEVVQPLRRQPSSPRRHITGPAVRLVRAGIFGGRGPVDRGGEIGKEHRDLAVDNAERNEEVVRQRRPIQSCRKPPQPIYAPVGRTGLAIPTYFLAYTNALTDNTRWPERHSGMIGARPHRGRNRTLP